MPPTPSQNTRRTPQLTLMALAGGVALLHLALWHGVSDSFAAMPPPERKPPTFQVRTVAPPSRPAALPPVAVAAPAKPAPRQRTRRASAETPASKVPDEPAPAETAPVLVAAALPARSTTELTPVAASSASAQDDLPVYRTKMPPAMTLHYDMHRGALSGTGQFQWRPAAGGYQARLEGRMAGFSILTWASQGGFDEAGLAPVRYTDQRRNKAAQAANFQRDAGKITFSGPSTEYPLVPGAQDRLSWMIQIAAIALAEPKRVARGARVSMYVVGARGDAEAWHFRVVGTEEVTTGDTSVRAVKLLREPRRPHDTRVEVWLAPNLHYLPVRARLTSEGSALDLVMQTSEPAS